ncbi:hypothetical protein WA026_021306 [Henosepilachna vigintioctopunctata]|uniref:Uncharacterized protein n=1 Tax=Henosepilachna vigintioctopunctata TaxID=420089 RepID=A0AAW1U6X3_9CUCU
MDKLQFEFTILSGQDGKSNVYALTSISTQYNKIYDFPEDSQTVGLHKELIKTAAFAKVKNRLKTRHQVKTVWITMTSELLKVYVDVDGNMQFGDHFLEEIHDTEYFKQTEEKFALEKFTSRNTNAKVWIKTS